MKFSKVTPVQNLSSDEQYYHALRSPIEKRAKKVIEKELNRIARKATSVKGLQNSLEEYRLSLKEKGYTINFRGSVQFWSDTEGSKMLESVQTHNFVRGDVMTSSVHEYKITKGWNALYEHDYALKCEREYFNFQLGERNSVWVVLDSDRDSKFEFNVGITTTLR